MRKQIVVLTLCALMLFLCSVVVSQTSAKNPDSSSESTGANAPQTLFTEGFEGAFPGTSWLVGDGNSANGYDYWDDTSYKFHTGLWSGWCAQVGTHANTVTIFTEGFEGTFPAPPWLIEDFNTASGYDYWDDTPYRSYSGGYSAWCAERGWNNYLGNWNNVLHRYDNNMDTRLYRPVNLAGYTSATLSFKYWLDSELNFDYFTPMWYDQMEGWRWISSWQKHGGYGYWQSMSVSIPTSAKYVGFKFYSDDAYVDEGVYIDDVVLTATTQINNTVDHKYDNYMDSIMYRPVSLGGYSSATLSYWYWLDSEPTYDVLTVMYFSGGVWYYVLPHAGHYGYWQYASLSIPTSATNVGFRFHTDGSVTYGGVYLDDILLTATPHTVRLESRQDTGSTSNLGTITFAGTTYALPVNLGKKAGSYVAKYSPPSGYEFKSWQTSGAISVASATANPTTATVSGSGTVRAVYRRVFFADGFESGNFIKWTSTGVTSGETAMVTGALRYSGIYSALFTSNGNGGTERAYCFKTITSQPQLYARAYFRVATSGIVDNGDSFYLVILKAGTNAVAFAGWRKTAGVIRWFLQIRSGTSYVYTYSATTPSLNVWYRVEIRWVNNAVSGLGQLWVNGALVCSITGKNTATYGNVNRLDFGLPQVTNCAPTRAFVDSVKVANTYIGA